MRPGPQPPQGPRTPLSSSSRRQHILAEMLSTEREYVRSLGYVIDNYFPEMERTDLPQALRGKRSVVFGNLEKLYDFHGQRFLAELEHCQPCPLAAGRGFLRHVSPSLPGTGLRGSWLCGPLRGHQPRVPSERPALAGDLDHCRPGLGDVSLTGRKTRQSTDTKIDEKPVGLITLAVSFGATRRHPWLPRAACP